MDAEIWKVEPGPMMLWLVIGLCVITALTTPTLVWLALTVRTLVRRNNELFERVDARLSAPPAPPPTAPLRAALAKVGAPSSPTLPALPPAAVALVEEAHFGPGSRASSPVPEEPRHPRGTMLPRV